MKSQPLILLLLGLLPALAHARVWTVTPAQALADVVAQAAAGDELRIQPGRYRVNLHITKPLTLTGVGRPTLDGGNASDVIRIESPDVTVQGLIIANSGGDLGLQNAGVYVAPGSHRAVVRHNDISYSLFGLWIEKANDVRVENNLITGKRDYIS